MIYIYKYVSYSYGSKFTGTVTRTGVGSPCQTQRDQFQNRENCMRMLRSKLLEIKEREHLDKISDIKGVQQKIEWGSQIRNYVFMPYTLLGGRLCRPSGHA